MGTTEILATIGAVAAVIAAAAQIAGLKDEGRARLLNWARHTGRWLYRLFLLVGIGNSILGIAAFGLSKSPLTRGDVLILVLHLFNFFMIGLFAISEAASRAKERRRLLVPEPARTPH